MSDASDMQPIFSSKDFTDTVCEPRRPFVERRRDAAAPRANNNAYDTFTGHVLHFSLSAQALDSLYARTVRSMQKTDANFMKPGTGRDDTLYFHLMNVKANDPGSKGRHITRTFKTMRELTEPLHSDERVILATKQPSEGFSFFIKSFNCARKAGVSHAARTIS